MFWDFGETPPRMRSRLLHDLIVPRPIAFVTTVDEHGIRNAAPFSFFNVMGHDPPILVLGLEQRADGSLKDTTHNIRMTGEFVVNLVTESLVEAANACSAPVPPDVDEIVAARLETGPSRFVRPPRILEAPASLECTERMTISFGRGRTLVVGEVVAIHVQDVFYDDSEGRVLTSDMHVVARMHGRDVFVRTRDVFVLERPRASASTASQGKPKTDSGGHAAED